MSGDWVFGLSIDTEVACGLAQVDPSSHARGDKGDLPAYPGRVLFFKLADLNTRWRRSREDLAAALDRLRGSNQLNALFAQVKAVGISSVGMVDRGRLTLLSSDRLRWRLQTDDRTLDVASAVRQAFPEFHDRPTSIHNDATAKAAAYRCFDPAPVAGAVCNVLMGEGVNVGLAGSDGPLSADFHPEMGHGYPRLHPLDAARGAKALRAVTGCDEHVDCYEGLASGMRQRNDRQALARLTEAQRRDMLADYAGQLCWNATVALRPDRIMLSGGVVDRSLLPAIQEKFIALKGATFARAGYPGPPGAWVRDYIRLAKSPIYPAGLAGIDNPDGVMGALELARAALKPRPRRRSA